MKAMTVYWLLWLFAGFGIPEAIALLTGHFENTLSENAWRWFQVVPGGGSPWHWTFLHLIVSVLLLWLWAHITFRLFT